MRSFGRHSCRRFRTTFDEAGVIIARDIIHSKEIP